MKGFAKISLRMRLTLLTALVMTLVAVVLTISSIGRAGTFFVPDNYHVSVGVPAATITTTPAVTAVVTDGEVNSFTYQADSDQVPLTDILLSNVTIITEDKPAETAQFTKIRADAVDYQAYPLEALTLTVAAKKEFAFSSMWVLLAVIAAGTLMTWLMAGRALKPVRVLADTVGEIDARSLSLRVQPSGADDEIRQLTDGFNNMLDKLEQAFIQQKTFSANAAHELKTPLAAIRSNIEILDMDESPSQEDYQETLEIIRRNTDRLISLVGDLLALNDEQQCDFQEQVDTQRFIEAVCQAQAGAAEAKQLTMTVTNELPVIYGSERLLSSAVGNLVENAVKYTPAGGQIWLSVSQQQEQAVIAVWNDGAPIAQEQLAHIFEPFYRIDESRSSKIAGSGLGLSLVQSIAHKHGGEVTVRSTAEEGTTFILTIPQGISQ